MGMHKVLIVEDNLIVAEDLKTKLGRIGHQVVAIAKNGKQAIVEAMNYLPELVLMDIQLGKGMNGIETVAILRKEYNPIVIYITAYADEETVTKAKSTKPYGFINKPFDDEELKSTIEAALQKQEPKL